MIGSLTVLPFPVESVSPLPPIADPTPPVVEVAAEPVVAKEAAIEPSTHALPLETPVYPTYTTPILQTDDLCYHDVQIVTLTAFIITAVVVSVLLTRLL